MSLTKKLRTGRTTVGHMRLSIIGFAQNRSERINGLKDVPYDVKLQVGPDKEIVEAHRDVLKAEIAYFSAMFSGNFQESSKETISLPDIDSADAVKKLVDFSYKGTISVNQENVQELFQVCDIWGLDEVKSKCVVFMIEQVDCHNCLELFCFAELYSIKGLASVCQDLISREFQIICKLDSFLEIPANVVMMLVQMQHLNLGQQGEDCLVDAITRWAQHNVSERRKHLSTLLPHLKFSLCSQRVLDDFVNLHAESVKEAVDERIRLYKCHPDWVPVGVENRRHRKENIMVFSGYSHTRSGPTSPRLKSAEIFNVETLKSRTIILPDEASYGVALNLMGRVIYFSVRIHTDKMTNWQITTSKVYTIRPEQPSPGDVYKDTPEIFSDRVKDCITNCLTHRGCVVHCPVKNVIYAVSVDSVDCIKYTFTGGEIFCDYDKPVASLKNILSGENYVGMRSACHSGKLYVIGGNYGPQLEPSFSNRVFVLNEDESQWVQCQQMNMHRTEFAVASYGDSLIVSGGYGGKNSLRRLQNCESFFPPDNCWVKFFSLQQSRSHHCMLVANRDLYTIAGKTYSSQKRSNSGLWLPGGARIVSSLVEKFNRQTGLWERLGRLNHARCMFSAVAV